MSLQNQTAPMYAEIMNKVQQMLDSSTQQRTNLYFENAISKNMSAGTSNIDLFANLAPYFIYLPEAYVELTITGVANVDYITNFGFFKSATLNIGDVRLEDVSDCQLAATLRALVENTKDYNESVLSSTGFSTEHLATNDVKASILPDVSDPVLRVEIPLTSLFASVKFLPLLYGVEIKLNFVQNPPSVMAVQNGVNPVAIHISDLRLVVPSYVPSPEMKVGLEEFISQNSFESEFAIESTYTRVSNAITNANPSDSWTINGTPVRLYTVLLANNTAATDRMEFNNPTTFLQSVQLQYDGQNVLSQAMRSATAGDLQQAYHAYVDIFRKQNNILGCPMSYAEFKLNNTVYCFDLTNQPESLFKSAANHTLTYEITAPAPAGGAPYNLGSVVIRQQRVKIIGSNRQIYLAQI